MKLLYSTTFFLFVFLTACGYQSGRGGSLECYSSVTVPFAKGDRDGDFTASLIQEVTRSGAFQYHQSCGELILEVDLVDIYDHNIGWRYDLDRKQKETDSLIPTETRMFAIAEVKAIERCSGFVVAGPVLIRAHLDFDHDYYSSRDGINVTSLGQLSDIDVARDDALQPLYRVLSEKIVDYLITTWN